MTSMTPHHDATLTLVVNVPRHIQQARSGQEDAPSSGGGFLALAVLVAVLVVAYRISVHLHPFTKCSTCRGSGKHFGAVFKSAHRPCDACRGTGRKPRRGSRAQ
ncbi:hypothetical protein GCM10023191_101720 [Actinoallomurus oryzae]|uniref:Chaperone protein DnaJ n=1 Tax=Actinoallomurus oryzae TaxID=502180 RepID=A0ABP8R9L3_9ACTN